MLSTSIFILGTICPRLNLYRTLQISSFEIIQPKDGHPKKYLGGIIYG